MSIVLAKIIAVFNSLGSHPMVIAYVLAGFLIVVLLLMWRLERRLNKFLLGKNAKTLEDSILGVSKDLKDVHVFIKDMQQYLTSVETRLKKSVQGVSTIRYNPFKGTGSGGNNSFSVAFLNEKGDGTVLTSLYARERMSVFAKPIEKFASAFELSEEEVESINTCKEKLTTS